jgi:hypothetical protein
VSVIAAEPMKSRRREAWSAPCNRFGRSSVVQTAGRLLLCKLMNGGPPCYMRAIPFPSSPASTPEKDSVNRCADIFRSWRLQVELGDFEERALRML